VATSLPVRDASRIKNYIYDPNYGASEMPATGNGPDSGGSQRIDRAPRLLAMVAKRHRNGAQPTEFVRESGLNQATARRILVALIRACLIEQSEAARRSHLGVSTYVDGPIASDRFARRAP
jgi:hypothetical protein